MTRPSVVLCDLDGTITDSIPGIHRCLRLALPSIDLGDLTDDQVRAFLGPPLHFTLKEVYGKSDADVETFVTIYRAEYFGGGEYEFALFPGMAQLIKDIGASDISLVLATAKPIESAERVLVEAGLFDCFDAVSGSELDLRRQGKPDVIAHGLSLIGAVEPFAAAVMIGDRKEDVLGAQHHGFDSIGVSWGYADEGELASVHPTHIVDSPDQIRPIIGL